MRTEGIQDGLVILRVTMLLCCAIGFTFAGCSSAPEIYHPAQMPSYIREFKTLKLYGHVEKKDTKIDLTAGEYVSIMVDGEIRRWKNAPPADATSLLTGISSSSETRARTACLATSSSGRAAGTIDTA